MECPTTHQDAGAIRNIEAPAAMLKRAVARLRVPLLRAMGQRRRRRIGQTFGLTRLAATDVRDDKADTGV